MKRLSPGEEMFALHCRAYGLDPEREYPFCPDRKFRFDFCFPDRKIAVEIEGGTRTNGRHSRHAGFTADCVKYNLATALGWKVFRYTSEMVTAGSAIDEVLAIMSPR